MYGGGWDIAAGVCFSMMQFDGLILNVEWRGMEWKTWLYRKVTVA